MARAICQNCGRIVSWSASRGSRLSGFNCPECKAHKLKAVRCWSKCGRDKDLECQKRGYCEVITSPIKMGI